MQFDLPKDQSSIIKVFGIGGGGSNAVNHMYKQGIKGVDFVICNTDNQALDISPVPLKIQLGSSLTNGRGAGSIPEVGKNAAIEDIEQIREILSKNTKMVFITAGMGGGTGTGAAPVIAQVAKEMGILTVGIVTMPFLFEGRKRKLQASEGIETMRQCVDTLLVINNDKLREMFGNLSLRDAFEQADNVLTTAAKGIAEVITVTGAINVDFEDVSTVMKDSGVAIMGSATATGEDRAEKSVAHALASPLLNDNNIDGANYVLLNITYGEQEIMMDEIADITDYIQAEAGNSADVIWGHGYDETLGDSICVTVIATGFSSTPDTGEIREVQKKVVSLEADVPISLTQPIKNPVSLGEQETSVQQDESKEEEPYMVNPSESSQKEMSFDITNSNSVEAEPVNDDVTDETPINETPVAEVKESPDQTWDFSGPSIPTSTWTPDLTDESTDNIKSDEKVENTAWEPFMKETDEVTSIEESSTAESPTPDPEKSYEEPYLKQEATAVTPEEQQARSSDRIGKLKELSMRLRTPSGIADMENEPAYKRRQVELDDVEHSSDSQASRYTLREDTGVDGENRTTLNDNNSFLHDNVD
ncbi:MAG: cell division protein FtsZ [Flavobacteriales bacterium]|nr:cell division protein FtsZ [Flavobacteriales bacterium]